jgi:hypothetical protein
VRLGPNTPGDYVRARVLVPRNPGVTKYQGHTRDDIFIIIKSSNGMHKNCSGWYKNIMECITHGSDETVGEGCSKTTGSEEVVV